MNQDQQYIRERSEAEPMGGCWIWTAALMPNGYGVAWRCGSARPRGERRIYAHRLSFEAFVRPIPEGYQIDHRCRVRCCVNPSHLRAVTQRENLLAPGSLAPPRANAEKTHCVRGHSLAGANLRLKTNGRGRDCRACNRLRAAWHRDAKNYEHYL